MEQKKEIRFIDSQYRELFRVLDGANINIIYPPEDSRGTLTRPVKYLDEMHINVGNADYHICEFAQRMEAIGARYEPATQLRDVAIAPFTMGEEKFFTYNREEGNTCVGHISGNFAQQGDRFNHSWSGRITERDTPEFYTELHCAIYALRQSILKDRDAMIAYCLANPGAILCDGNDYKQYGFKVDTEMRQYFVLCHVPEYTKETRFSVYAYDKAAPERGVEQPEVVQGYTVIDKTVVGRKTFVIAHNPKAVSPYVTWQGHVERDGYDWGHYFSDKAKAFDDYVKRFSEERKYEMELHHGRDSGRDR
ncbi:MAG TPA: hypothetical protein VN608_09860 [Clostridia bacterium]|nr:hypothetical protein [Clostridia bacterium]